MARSGTLLLPRQDFAQQLLAAGRNAPVQDVLVVDAGFDDAQALEQGQTTADGFPRQTRFLGQAGEVAKRRLGRQGAQNLDVVVRQGFFVASARPFDVSEAADGSATGTASLRACLSAATSRRT